MEGLLSRIIYEKWKTGKLELKLVSSDDPSEWQGKLEDAGIWVTVWTDYESLNVQKSKEWIKIRKDPYVKKLCWELMEKYRGEVVEPNLKDILEALGVV